MANLSDEMKELADLDCQFAQMAIRRLRRSDFRDAIFFTHQRVFC